MLVSESTPPPTGENKPNSIWQSARVFVCFLMELNDSLCPGGLNNWRWINSYSQQAKSMDTCSLQPLTLKILTLLTRSMKNSA